MKFALHFGNNTCPDLASAHRLVRLAEAAGFDKMTTIIEVELDDGTVVKGRADFGKGSPANPMTDEELAEKFRQCAAWGGLNRDQAKTVLDLVWRIDELKDVHELMKQLRHAKHGLHL